MTSRISGRFTSSSRPLYSWTRTYERCSPDNINKWIIHSSPLLPLFMLTWNKQPVEERKIKRKPAGEFRGILKQSVNSSSPLFFGSSSSSSSAMCSSEWWRKTLSGADGAAEVLTELWQRLSNVVMKHKSGLREELRPVISAARLCPSTAHVCFKELRQIRWEGEQKKARDGGA